MRAFQQKNEQTVKTPKQTLNNIICFENNNTHFNKGQTSGVKIVTTNV